MKSKIRYFPSDTVIAKAGDVWHSMYLICHGSIQFFMPPDSGSDWEEDGKSAWQKLETVELLPNVESNHVAQTGRKLSSLSDIGRTIKEVAKKRKESDSFLKTSHEYVMTMERWSMFGEELLVGNGLAICGVRKYSRLFVCARVLISGCQLFAQVLRTLANALSWTRHRWTNFSLANLASWKNSDSGTRNAGRTSLGAFRI